MDKETEYSLFLGHINKLTDRRQKVTATYLSVNAAIVGGIAFVVKDLQVIEWGRQLATLLLLLAGIIVCGLWRRLIRQHSTLIGWWYIQLRTLEEAMTDGSRLLTQEYEELYTVKVGGVTRYETRLTWVFTIIYGIFGLIIVISLLFF